MKVAKIGILMDRNLAEAKWKYGLNVFEYYLGEILSQAGITFEWVESAYHIQDGSFDIVIAGALREKEKDTNYTEIIKYLNERKGIVISYAGLNGLAKQFGYIKGKPLSVGYAQLDKSMGDAHRLLRYLKGCTWEKDAHSKDVEGAHVRSLGCLKKESPQGETTGTLLDNFSQGLGRLDRWSVNIPETIVSLQQGSQPVLEDGSPSTDGKGKINEGLLKADDQIEMDWQWDRETTETGAVYFAHAYADLWRESLVQHLIQCAFDLGKTLPFIGYWPEGVKGVAMISHDSDSNIDEAAVKTMESLKQEDVRSTWCMIKPGFSKHIHERILNEGHELAFHYNANYMHGGDWGREEFHRQFNWLQTAAGGEVKIHSNKNHYTRFEGWGELFEWCEECGIQSDETRGPSKKGNVGFIFGTCHPYFPIAWSNDHNRIYDVLEIGFLTQDIPVWSDSSVVEPFLEEVKRVQGVAHFLFHQSRIYKSDEVHENFHKVIQTVKQHGFEFWTGVEINEWIRYRRTLKINGMNPHGVVSITGDYQKAVVWVPVCPAANEKPPAASEIQFGFWCEKQRNE
jgi:hypothetical protein